MPEPGDPPGLTELAGRWARKLADIDGVSIPPHQLESTLRDYAREAHAEFEAARDAAIRRFTALYIACPIGVALTDADGVIVECNPALARVLGREMDTVRGRTLDDLAHTDKDAATLRAGLTELTGPEVSLHRERLVFEHGEDASLWVRATMAQLPGEPPGSAYPVLMVEDDNEIHLLQETLRHQTVHDSLTGLPNAAQFTNRLETLRAAGGSGRLALVYLDLDGFKVINDGLGAGVGDQVLRGVAGKLASAFTTHGGFVARLTGDGFAILLTGELTATDVIALVEGALDDLAEPQYVDDAGVGVSASAGIVVREVRDAGSPDLLRAAEIALHRAKEAGKAQWMLFDPQLDAHDRGRYRMGATIAGALENGQFVATYQPVVTLTEPTHVTSVHTQLRWHHPEWGTLRPESFYPLAETIGMVVPLGRWLLNQSFRAAMQWHEQFARGAPDVCVRLPTRLAIDDDLVGVVKAELDRHGLPPASVRLCTDPHALLDPRGELLESMAVLTDLGATVVLEVSGTADLELIASRELPIHHIVLAASVVTPLTEDTSGADSHVAQLLARARELSLRVDADGVRDPDQARLLREQGVTAASGPVAGEPEAGAAIDELVANYSQT